MTRFVLVLAALSLGVGLPASAEPDDDEEFDLLSDDAPEVATPDQVVGGGIDDAAEPEVEMDIESGVPAPTGDEPTEDDILGNIDGDPDEDFMPDFNGDKRKEASRPATQGPGPTSLDVAGKEPFADNYPVSVVSVDRDSVVVELPVLVGRSRVGFDKPFSIVGEVAVGSTKVATVRADITEQSLADFGPSFVFLKVLVPVADKEGQITVTVKKDDAELFARSTPYSL